MVAFSVSVSQSVSNASHKSKSLLGAWWGVRLGWEELLLCSRQFPLFPQGRRERQSCYPSGAACGLIGFLLWAWEGTQMVGPFPPKLLSLSFVLGLPSYPSVSSAFPGHSSHPSATSLSRGSSSRRRGRSVGDRWDEAWSRFWDSHLWDTQWSRSSIQNHCSLL